MSRRKLELVAVHWLDAATTSGWEDDVDAASKPHSVFTVGFLIRESNKVLVVASTIDGEDMNNARINIPIGMVVSLKRFTCALPLKGIQCKSKPSTPAKRSPKPTAAGVTTLSPPQSSPT